jgi:uncharacterized protein
VWSVDPFADALTGVEQLRELYEEPEPRVLRKDIGRLDELCRRLIAASPMVLIGSSDAAGRLDVTPRGGPPGFVSVIEGRCLAIPDATGNRRLDTLRNVLATGRVGLLFLIPGRPTTLRVNGGACVTAQADLLDALTAVGKRPRTAIVVDPDEVYAHCPKAFIRSSLWDPHTWPSPDSLPSAAEVSLAHQADPGLTLADVERSQRESVLYRLD